MSKIFKAGIGVNRLLFDDLDYNGTLHVGKDTKDDDWVGLIRN